MWCIIALVTGYKMNHFREMIDNRENTIPPLFVLGNPKTKSIEIASQDTIGTGRGT
jgi:hypothetical protein